MSIEVDFSLCQSLAQLSVALNGAYFTYRSATQPRFDQVAEKYCCITKIAKRSDLSSNNQIISSHAVIDDMYHSIKKSWESFYDGLFRHLMYFAYGACMISLILLLISTIMPTTKINISIIVIASIILYLPVLISILREVLIYKSINGLFAKIDKLYAKCEAIVQENQRRGGVVHGAVR